MEMVEKLLPTTAELDQFCAHAPRLQLRHETGVDALEIATRIATAGGRLRHAKALNDLRDGLLTRIPARARVEADAEAVLAAMGQVTRPGPKVSVAPDILDTIIEALRGPFRLRVTSNLLWIASHFNILCSWFEYQPIEKRLGSNRMFSSVI